MDNEAKTDFRHRPVGEVVAENYLRAAVFKRFDIDFCCGGGRTVAAACEKAGTDYEELERALAASDQSGAGSDRPDPRGWDLDFLADYIVNVHHGYVRENLPVLLQFSNKVARVHGGAHEELIEIDSLTEEIAAEMEQHMLKEEQMLFPYIRSLATARKNGTAAEPPFFGTVRNPIHMMEHEHDRAGSVMKRIRELTADFTPPEGACNTYRALYAKLEEFEDDLHRHVHLENNILFPGATAMEDELTGGR